MYPQNAPYPGQPQVPQGYPQQAPQGYPQQYPPQAPQGYPPQGYPQQAPPQAPLARGTLSDFYGQPSSSGGPSLKFQVLGTSYAGTIARDVTDADIKQQTAFQTGVPLIYRDGRPKLAMVVPIALSTGPSAEFPEGVANYWVKGADRDELLRAMTAAGVQPDQDGVYRPKGGDQISVTYVQDKPGRAGMNPTKLKSIQYVSGQGQAAPAPQQVAQQAFNQVVQPQFVQPVQQFPPTPNPQAPVQQAPLAQVPQAQFAQPVAQPVQQAAAVPGLTPEQAAMVAQMTNQQVQQG